jgi:ArsR family transcriptional regulator
VDDSKTVERFRALGDPVRWAIVRELQAGTRCACVLAELTSVSAPLLSHHLKVLREAGLIAGAKRGRWIDYTLVAHTVSTLAALIDQPNAVPAVVRGRVTTNGALAAAEGIR